LKSIPSGLLNTLNEQNKMDNNIANDIQTNKNIDPDIQSPNSNNSNIKSPVALSPAKNFENSLQSLIEAEEKGEAGDNAEEEIELQEQNNKNENSHDVELGQYNSALESENETSSKTYSYVKDRLFTLKEKNVSSDTDLPSAQERASSLRDMKIGIHRKISKDRTKSNILRKHSSLKDLKIQYSNNLQTMQREKKCKNDGKRVGLPAELFANDVSFVTKCSSSNSPKETKQLPIKPKVMKSDINGSFYSIPIASPVRSYANPYFQSDDVMYSSLDLPASRAADTSLNVKRPSTSDRWNNKRGGGHYSSEA